MSCSKSSWQVCVHRCSPRNRLWFTVALVWMSVLWSGQVRAENTAFQLQQFRPWGDPKGMFLSQSGETLEQWNYTVALYLNYGYSPLTFRPLGGGKVGIVDHQLGADLLGAVGLLRWLDVGLNIPMTLYQVGIIPSSPSFAPDDRGRSVTGFSFSDIKLFVKAQTLREKKHFLNLGFQIYLGFPSGSKSTFNGEDGVSFGLATYASKRISIFTVALNLGYRYLPSTALVRLPIQHELTYSLGGSARVLKKRLDVLLDIGGATAVSELTTVNVAPLEVYLGARVFLLKNSEDLALTSGVSFPLTPGYGAPSFRALVGVAWTPQKRDTDSDGLLDRADRCPTRRGPRANQGCPWPDADGDGLTDNVDKCPKRRGPKGLRGCPDTDGDGLHDLEDTCPKRKGEKANNGCPWSDTDRDGVTDNVDRCPKRKGEKANKGCPWGDADNDGVTDNVDKCPNIAGVKANKGCPDKDRDGDGVVDRLDRCPNVPGSKAKRGCPQKVLVKMTGKKLLILKKIQFQTGRSRILRRSFGILNQMVSILKSRPKLKLRVEGHTDNRGGKRYNLGLSKRRASAVRRYLIRKGISGSRLTSQGYGMSKPLVPNVSRRNRAKNRRVQFTVLAK